MIYQDMMDDPVSKIGGKDLPEFWPGGNKADRTGWSVRAGLKRLLQGQQVRFLMSLKVEGI